nr:hypothetical protein [uncultured Chryseobacterium sp.]
MFPFTYTFKIEITAEKTLKNITDAARDSFMERDINMIEIQGNTVIGKDSLVKLDFSNRYPLTLSPGKEYFIYDESKRILTYKVEVFFNIIYAAILFLILYFFAHHWVIELVVPTIFFIFITMVSYLQYHAVIDKISKKLN